MKTKILIAISILLVVIVVGGYGFGKAQGQKETQLTGQAASTYFRQPMVNYQGVLKENGNLVSGNRSLVFHLHDADDCSGTELHAYSVNTSVNNGLFNVDLDFGTDHYTGDSRYLQVLIGATQISCQEITSVPYALFADSVPWGGVLDRPAQTIIVAKSGGDFNTITAALASITDATDTKRYLIKVAPGEYIERVTMKQFVDIEGSGEQVTKIRYTQANPGNLDNGTLVGANDCEVRFLTVSSIGGTHSVAIYNFNSSMRMTHVTAVGLGGVNNYGVFNSYASGVMTDVTAKGEGGSQTFGVFNNSSSTLQMKNVSIEASGGTTNYGVFNSSSSLQMMELSITLSEGIDNYGIENYISSPVMKDITINVSSGASLSFGVLNGEGTAPEMTNMSITVSDGYTTYGIKNIVASPVINNSVIVAKNASTMNLGIYNEANGSTAFTVKVNNSKVTGSTVSIYNSSVSTVRVGASMLDGFAQANSGPLTCVSSFNGSYAVLNSACQ
jgi:hypothetical protein